MKLKFTKYSATGNDFAIFDNRDGAASQINGKVSAKLCDRRDGIGADGVVLINKSDKYDYSMQIYNADGSEAEMCGNAARALVSLACEELKKDHVKFSTFNGVYEGGIYENEYFVEMTELYDEKKYSLGQIVEKRKIYLNTGVPHVVIESEGFEEKNFVEYGRNYRNLSELHAGANINFIKKINQSSISLRTYERGVEDETRSCGTGCVASAIAACEFYGMKDLVNIQTSGGNIRILFKDNKRFLIGSVKKSFVGEIDLEG